jgi:hypothetical protein
MPFSRRCQVSEYLNFIQIRRGQSAGSLKLVFDVQEKKAGFSLGVIRWHSPWKEYVFSVSQDSIWSAECLSELREFLLKLNRKILIKAEEARLRRAPPKDYGERPRGKPPEPTDPPPKERR